MLEGRAVRLPRYVVLRPRADGTTRVLFELPTRFRPAGWRPAIPLPLTEARRGDLTNEDEVRRIIEDGEGCYRSYLKEVRGGSRRA